MMLVMEEMMVFVVLEEKNKKKGAEWSFCACLVSLCRERTEGSRFKQRKKKMI